MGHLLFGGPKPVPGKDAAGDVGPQFRLAGQLLGRGGEDAAGASECFEQMHAPFHAQTGREGKGDILDFH